MGWLSDLFQGLPVNAVLRERLALAEGKVKDIEIAAEKLKDEIKTLTQENQKLKKQVGQATSKSKFVELRGVYWKADLDGSYLPYCPTCETALAEFPPGAGDSLRCRKCKFKAPFHPQEVSALVEKLGKGSV